MADVATLGITVDSSQAAKALEQFAKDAGISTQAAMALEAESKRLGKTLEETARFAGLNKASIILAARSYDTAAAAAGKLTSATASANREIEKHTRAANDNSKAFGLFARQMTAVAGEANSLAGSLGRVAPFLTALGPGGVAIAAGLGLVVLAMKQLADASLALANRAGDFVDLSDTIGLTVRQLQALEIAGARVGVNQNQLRTGLEKFADTLQNVRTGEESAVKSADKLSEGLSKQLQGAKTTSQALTLVFEALSKVDKVAAVAAARDFFGRGGSGFARLASSVGDVNKFAEAMNNLDLITRKQAESWDAAGDTIAINATLIKQNLTAAFADAVLETIENMSEALLEFSRAVRQASQSAEGLTIRNFLEIFINPQLVAGVAALASALVNLGIVIANLNPGTIAWSIATGKFKENLAQAQKAAQDATADFQSVLDIMNKIKKGAAPTAGTASDSGNAPGHGNLLGTDDPEIENRLKKQTIALKETRKAALDYVDVLKNNVTALGDAATEAEKYALKIAELTKKFQEGEISADTFNRAIAAANPVIKSATDAITQVGDGLARAFIEGASAVDALHRSLSAVAATASSSVIKSLLKGATGQGFDFTSIGSNLAIGGAALLIDNIFGFSKKAEQEAAAKAATDAMNQANDALKNVTDSFMTFTAAADGAVTAVIKNGQQQFQQLKDAADAALAAANAVVNTPGNTPAVMAAANQSRDLANASVIAATSRLKEFNQRTIETGRESLRGAAQLSQTGQALQDLTDKAKDLNEAMVLTGTSAEEAAMAVADDLAEGLRKLKVSIETDVGRKINDLAGKGWINDLRDLFTEIADANKAGADATLLSDYLAASAQQIVNSAKLTGDAFDELLATFPQLSGVVVDFSESAAAAADNLAEAQAALDAINERAAALQDRLFAANVTGFGQGSTLSGSLALFDRSAQQQREAEIKAGGENIVLLEETLAQERINIVSDSIDKINARAATLQDRLFSASLKGFGSAGTLAGDLAQFDRDAQHQREAEIAAGGENIALLEQVLAQERANIIADANAELLDNQKRTEDQRLEIIKRANQDIVAYLQGLMTGSLSPLNAKAQLEAARSAYEAQLALASAGDLDALQNITKVADTFLQASQKFFGSSKGYQTDFQRVQVELGGLAGMSEGGLVTGGVAGRDSVPKMLEPGEYVMSNDMVKNVLQFPRRGDQSVVNELRALRNEHGAMQAQLARIVKGSNGAVVMAIKGQTREMNAETRKTEDGTKARQRRRVINE